MQNYALNIGIEVVGSRLLDGMGSIDHVSRIEFEPGFYVDFIGVEDLIADRVAQADATSRLDRDRLEQAIVLFKMLVDRIDAHIFLTRLSSRHPDDPWNGSRSKSMRFLGKYDDFTREQARRAREIGLTDDVVQRLRTRDETRTPSKLILLAAIRERSQDEDAPVW